MSFEQRALEFLDVLERSEQKLLTWGLIDGFFTEQEIEDLASEFIDQHSANCPELVDVSDRELVAWLVDAGLVWRIPYSGGERRYRTRFAEAVRLFATLRQIFPDPQRRAWRNAPRLVADYRLLRQPRRFPRRHVPFSSFLNILRNRIPVSAVQAAVTSALLRAGDTNALVLADFQVNATVRILEASRGTRMTGTVVSAGTGSGKTLAFYLPTFLAIAESIDQTNWTRCLAIYPRKELLKDQLREAFANGRRIKAALNAHGRRGIVLGALYLDVPTNRTNVTTRWAQHSYQGRPAWRCPYLPCPDCGGALVWREADWSQAIERLECVRATCSGAVEPDEVRLTRERMFASPPDILFTTTEMLNQRLSAVGYAQLFGVGLPRERQPRFVLLDEVHTYEGTDGSQAAYLLRRWRQRTRARPHFVGLSATLADAARFFSDLIGIGPGDVNEVTPGEAELKPEGADYQLALRGDPASGTSLLSTGIQAAMLVRRIISPQAGDPHAGSKVFAFTDNLDAVNRLYHDLLDAEGRNSAGRLMRPLGSLANLRARTSPNATDRFNVGQNWAIAEDIGHSLADGESARVGRTTSQDPGVAVDADIVVATSSLEVGFDDPEVGAVFQHKAPLTAAAFMQRKGRAGRRRSMRPWTVVALSDWGRDRRAYQAYERLFSPVIDARYLPLQNPAVLRMQATYALFDWLGAKITLSDWPDPWYDLASPARPSSSKAQRQRVYADWLRRLLEQPDVRDEFAGYLERALGIPTESVLAVLWEPPRAVLMSAVPTLLRRLETEFQRADGLGLDLHNTRSPLPDFVPRALFSDLQLPEIVVRLPAYRGGAPREELMPFVQALAEFVPGRVSRRFGVTDANERHWIHPGPDASSSVDVNVFSPQLNRRELGVFHFLENGQQVPIRAFRPYALDVVLPAANVRSSSNATLMWQTEFVPPREPYALDVPAGSPWVDMIGSIHFCTHHLGLPLEVRRFATAAEATIVRDGFPRVEKRIGFQQTLPGGGVERVALGFAADADAIEIRLRYPHQLHSMCARDERLVRGLRVARFRFLVSRTAALDGIANFFQREWLAQVYLTATAIQALQSAGELVQAEAAVFAGTAAAPLGQLAATILHWDNQGGNPNQPGQPRRLQELQALLARPDVLAAMHASASALWSDPDQDWEPWLRRRFKATLGAAIALAAHDVCPQTDPESLYLDIDAFSHHHRYDIDDLRDTLWLTEQSVGGGGIVETLVGSYAEDPRRFFGLMEAALGPSDVETVMDDLARSVTFASSGQPAHTQLRHAFATVRQARSHEDSARGLSEVRASLAALGILPTPTFLVALNARVLSPGSSDRTDALLSRILLDWDHAERNLGIDIDPRVIAFVHSRDQALENALAVIPEGQTDDARAIWRYGVLYGMLWSRGAELRAHMMRSANPFGQNIEADRLLVLSAVPQNRQRIPLASADWFDLLANALVAGGVAELVCEVGQETVLARALCQVAVDSIDIGGVLVHGRLASVCRTDNAWRAVIELPEALQ
jgi:hypothetical protein